MRRVLNKILPWALALAGVVIILPLSTALAVCPYPASAEVRQCDGNLSRGSRCQRVCELQAKLETLGYPRNQTLDVDGEYGPKTADAVTEYQQATSGLQVDGIAGPETLRSLGLPVPDTGGGGGNTTAGACPEGTAREKPGSFCIPTDGPQEGFAGVKNLREFTIKVIKFFLYGVGGTAVIYLMWGGYGYMTSAGNEENAEKAKKTIINGIIGVVVVVLAYAIVTVLVNTLTT